MKIFLWRSFLSVAIRFLLSSKWFDIYGAIMLSYGCAVYKIKYFVFSLFIFDWDFHYIPSNHLEIEILLVVCRFEIWANQKKKETKKNTKQTRRSAKDSSNHFSLVCCQMQITFVVSNWCVCLDLKIWCKSFQSTLIHYDCLLLIHVYVLGIQFCEKLSITHVQNCSFQTKSSAEFTMNNFFFFV